MRGVEWKEENHPLELVIKMTAMSVPPDLIDRSNAIPIKLPESYFADIDKWIVKFGREVNDLELPPCY